MGISTRTRGRRVVLVAIVLGAVAGTAGAGVIQGTGLGGPSTRDANWKVVALPGDFTEAPATPPYDAFVYQKGAIGWLGGEPFGSAQTGYTNADGTVYWIGVRSSTDSMFPFPTANTWIVAQEFTVLEAGAYDFELTALSDETFEFFVNGTVSPDAQQPTIVGGTQFGGTGGVTFATATTVTGSAFLNAGTNTVYARVRDTGFSTGVMMSQVNFTRNAVPEPSTALLALVGLAAAAGAALRRRRPA